MKILYIVSRPLEINTSASIRNKSTIKGLIENGHCVDLITTEPDKNHINYDKENNDLDINTKYLSLGGVQKIVKFGRRIPILASLKVWMYKLMVKFQIYDNLIGIVKYVNNLEMLNTNYDIIISSSDPKSSHLFAYELLKQEKIKTTPWIQLWGDPFYNDITRKNKFLDKKVKGEEVKLLKNATKVVYVSKDTLHEQQKLFPHYSKKMQYIPIPYYESIEYKNHSLETESLRFLYTGDYSSNTRNILPLYNTIKKTKHKLIICGNSDINLDETDRIKIFERVSFKKTKELESECDVLIHLSNLTGTQIPGKIYQYFGTNKPILFIYEETNQSAKNNFEKYNRCVFSKNTENDISKVIENIHIMSKGINNIPVEEFEKRHIAAKLIDLK